MRSTTCCFLQSQSHDIRFRIHLMTPIIVGSVKTAPSRVHKQLQEHVLQKGLGSATWPNPDIPYPNVLIMGPTVWVDCYKWSIRGSDKSTTTNTSTSFDMCMSSTLFSIQTTSTLLGDPSTDHRFMKHCDAKASPPGSLILSRPYYGV